MLQNTEIHDVINKQSGLPKAPSSWTLSLKKCTRSLYAYY